MNNFPRIGDLIEVPPVQTVIRLEEGRTRSEEISTSFVFTGEVTSHFAVLADALLKNHGRGFFLQGDFGAGKSHFLAILSAWLDGNPGSEILTERHGGLRRLQAAGRRFLTVSVSLVNYRATTPLERIIVEAVETALLSHGIEIRLTPLSAFLSYFATLLENKDLAQAFAEQAGIFPAGSEQIDAYLRSNPRQAYTAGMRFMKSHGMVAPEALVEDRHETFARVLKAMRAAGFDGLVIIIDELSEFFRSKPDARALNEDARTLQLVGELAAGEPLWIIAAVQESIERTGDISQVTFQKIKDRFPVKLVLSTLHIKALISERLVRKKPGCAETLHRVYDYLRRQFPAFRWRFEDFQATYPVHPITIALLDGLGDLFSEHRGIVDFVYTRLAGDQTMGIAGILDRPAYELLGPDSIYDHFHQRMAEFSGFNVYPRHVIPHLDEVIEQSIDAEDQDLARRIVRILVLYRIHPTADIPTVKEITEQAACALSDQDPSLNIQFVTEAILDPLVAKSKFLVKRSPDIADPLEAVYEVLAEEDPAKTLKARILRAASEIPADDSRLLTTVFSDMPESMSWPGPGFWEQGTTRIVDWRHSARKAFVAFLIPGEEVSLKDRLRQVLSEAAADFAVVISIGTTDFAMNASAVWEIPLAMSEENRLILREFLATKHIASGLQPSNPADSPLIEAVREAVERLKPAAQKAALTVFYAGAFTDARLAVDPVICQMKRFDRLLDEAGAMLLEERYPGYREIAPRKVAPSPRLYQRLLDEFIRPGSMSLRQAHTQGLNDAIEGLATPLGLVELRSGSYIFAPDPENHLLLSTVFGLMNTAAETRLSGVLHSLRTGRFGLPDDMAYFLLTALAYGGLITLMKNGRALPLDFLHLASVKNADALAPGEVIGRHDRETLMNECAFLAPAGGWESFGLRQQREAWQSVIKFRDWATKTVPDIARRLSMFAEFTAFKTFDLGSLQSQLDTLLSLCEEIKVSYPAREGLERFLKAWRGLGFASHQVEFIKGVRKFLAQQAEQFVFVNHYIRHTAVDHAGSEDHDIAELKNNVMQLLNHPDELVRDDDSSRLQQAFDSFRTVYASFYTQKHTEHYQQLAPKPLSRLAKRALGLLKRLAAIEALDRPPGLEALLQQVHAPKVSECRRNLTEELMRSPVCNCAFVPGETPRPPRIESPEKAIARYLDEYLQILKRPAVREAIGARIFALAEAAPDTTKRLRSLVSILEDQHASTSGLLDVLDDRTADEISKSLAGRVVIEKRVLGDLYSRLGGRRLAPDQVSEIVKEWMCPVTENAVIAIEDDRGVSSGSPWPSFSWWSVMHPALFKADTRWEIRNLEDELERQFPCLQLRDALNRLDDGGILAFITDEPFHTKAIRTAWLLLAERILAKTPWPNQAEISSRHVDREIAVKVQERLSVLNTISSFWNASFPDALRVRIPLSEIPVDSWVTEELRSLAFETMRALAQRGDEWLLTLPAVEPIELSDHPRVLIIDGISPDVWLEAAEALGDTVADGSLAWFRLESSPKTAEAVAALFGFSQDALDEFAFRDIPYHQVKGDEEHSFTDILPAFPAEKPVVIRVSQVDEGAHAGRLRLAEMPGAVCRLLERELPRLRAICAGQKRRLVVTTDHGFSLTRKGLSHGKGGVLEQAIFWAEWGIE
uniref:DUF6079 domain-containing protein n=1 Tax=Candidatus Desulfatibia profunda TaxID=2841695 RepID=A0A8J6TLJ7_9BACT|nr:hypothetical protein [Candidatus Desulfatibia profunda]